MFFIYEKGKRHRVIGNQPMLQIPYPILIFYNYYVLVALLLYLSSILSYGTGSYPLPPQGLHLSIRHIARASPLKGPCFIIACLAYSEQVGVKRQEGGVKGEINWR